MFDFFKKLKKDKNEVKNEEVANEIQPSTTIVEDANIPAPDANGNITITETPIVENSNENASPAPAAIEPVNAETVTPVNENITESVETTTTNPTAAIENTLEPEAAPTIAEEVADSSKETPVEEAISVNNPEPAVTEEVQVAPSDTENEHANKFCPNCGNMEPAEAIICSNCGSRL